MHIQSAKRELSGREVTTIETQIVTHTQTTPIFNLATLCLHSMLSHVQERTRTGGLSKSV